MPLAATAGAAAAAMLLLSPRDCVKVADIVPRMNDVLFCVPQQQIKDGGEKNDTRRGQEILENALENVPEYAGFRPRTGSQAERTK